MVALVSSWSVDWFAKPGKREGIFQSGKSQGVLNRLEKSGKITKYWKI